MNILVTHMFTELNHGDAAILRVLLHELKKIKGARLTVQSSDDVNIVPPYERVPSILHFVLYDKVSAVTRLRRLVQCALLLPLWYFAYPHGKEKSIIVLPKKLHPTIGSFLNADVIVATGGGYLLTRRTVGYTLVLILQLLPIVISKRLGKKVILFSQSVGPFSSSFHKWLTKKVIQNVDLIITRENISFHMLVEMGIASEKIFQSGDAAFLLSIKNESIRDKKYSDIVSNKRPLIGITVRGGFSNSIQTKYESVMISFVQSILNMTRGTVVLIPQCTSALHHEDDREVSLRIIKHFRNTRRVIHIDKQLKLEDILSLYRRLDYLVATRMHSAIFALNSRIPVLAISYEYKFEGIMNDLGLNSWVIPIQQVTSEKLQMLFKKMRQEQKIYRSKLRSVLPQYMKLSYSAFPRMRLLLKEV